MSRAARKSPSAPRKRTVRAVLIGLAAGLALFAAGLIVVNVFLLPRALSRLASVESGRLRFSAEIRRAWYAPVFGVHLRDLHVELDRAEGAGDEAAGLALADALIRRARVQLPISSAIAIARSNGTPDVDDLPPAATLRGVTLHLKPPGITVQPIDLDTVRAATSRRDGTTRVQVLGPAAEAVFGLEALSPGRVGIQADLMMRDLDIVTSWGARGTVTADLAATGSGSRAGSGWVWDLEGALTASNVGLVIPAIDPEEIAGLDLSYNFRASYSGDTVYPPPYRRHPSRPAVAFPRGVFAVHAGAATFNGLEVALAPRLRGVVSGPRSLDFRFEADSVRLGDVARAVPARLAGDLAGIELDGTLDLSLALIAPLDSVSDMQWRATSTLANFVITAIPESVNVFGVVDSFIHVIGEPGSEFRRVVELPSYRPAGMAWMLLHSEHSERRLLARRRENAEIAAARPDPVVLRGADSPEEPDPTYTYVRLEDMSPWIIRAVLTAEDGDFFFYRGINPVTLADAIEFNLEAGEILFGASTISMQLVKMLFLDTGRVFSRKLQELFLVYVMEQHVPVPKDRILELYLNLAEFGPGVYGVADAARIHFGKLASDLSAAEATWLASVLPAPGVWSFLHDDGVVDDVQYNRMLRLYSIMVERERMTEREYRQALRNRPIILSPPRDGDS